MRTVGTLHSEADKRKRTAQIFSMILLVILVFSSLGYSFFSSTNTSTNINTNNSSVQQTAGGQWAFSFGSRQILLTTSPQEARNVSFKDRPTLADFSQQVVYIDATDTITNLIGSSIVPYASRVQPACYGSCSRDLPEHDCNDTMIIWTNSDKEEVYKQGKCFFVDGDKRAADAFLYQIFGMLK